jgi:hypothetical protein
MRPERDVFSRTLPSRNSVGGRVHAARRQEKPPTPFQSDKPLTPPARGPSAGISISIYFNAQALPATTSPRDRPSEVSRQQMGGLLRVAFRVYHVHRPCAYHVQGML